MNKVSIYSSLPRTEFRGTSDISQTVISMPVSSKPFWLPLFASLAPWGEENRARYVNAAGVQLLYGNEVLDPRTPYFTHQSQILRSNFTGGASAMFLRLVDDAATQGNMRFAIDMVADKIPEYERNADGSIRRDATGAKIPTGEMLDGYRIQIRKYQIPVFEDELNYALGSESEGNMVSNDDGSTSTTYPFFDGIARFRGAKAGNLGVRISAPTIGSVPPADPNVNDRLGSFVFRFQQVERTTATSTPFIKPTLQGGQVHAFSFKEGAVDPATNAQYDIRTTLLPAFEGDSPQTFTGWGHFERFHVYTNHLTTVTNLLAAAEEAVTGEPIDPMNINFLTGVDVNGIEYNSFVVEGPEEGGLLMTANSTHYFEGGSDGVVSPERYNELFEAMLDNLEGFHVPLYDIAAYPYKSVIDSGFPLDIKLKFSAFHNLRPDVAVHVCTQDVAQRINTPEEDASILVALSAHFRAQQESQEFGTKALRFFCQTNAGYVIGSDYQGLVPFLEDTVIKVANYGGGANGQLNPANSFGRGSQNVIDRYKNHNVISRPNTVKNQDWSRGATMAQFFDIEPINVPAYQSMYEDQNSVCHSYINMLIICDLQQKGHVVWRNWSGDSQLTEDEFIDAINQNVIDLTEGFYDGRADITPMAYYTPLDNDLGFSYHLDILAGLNTMKTVQHLAVLADRRRGEAS